MIAFLKLIRLPNLLIIAFTMYMVRYGIVQPMAEAYGIGLWMPDLLFFLLVLSVVMIAAAGYIINDYFDVRMDQVNKPEHIVVDKGVKRRVAMGAHQVINVIAILIGAFVSWKANFFKEGTILFIFSATSLWFYSTTFKRQFLVGNLVIALLSGIVPLIAGFYDMTYIKEHFKEIILFNAQNNPGRPAFSESVFFFVLGFSFFAFILTLLREIIKDIEDREGDDAYGCKTLPVVMGVKGGKTVAAIIMLFILFMVVYLGFEFYQDTRSRIPFIYIVITLIIPLLLMFFMLIRAKEKKDFTRLSLLNKIIMLGGICFWLVLRFSSESGNWFG